MYNTSFLSRIHDRGRKAQSIVRRQTFAPEEDKVLRRFSSREVSENILGINQSTLRTKLSEVPDLPLGETIRNQRYFTLDEINMLRRKMRIRGEGLMPARPTGKRAIRAAVSNFKGGAGKSTVAIHFAHAAALDGYKVLAVDFDPQATLTHSMGVQDVDEERTVWGILVRDLVRETDRQVEEMACAGISARGRLGVPEAIRERGIDVLRPVDFIQPTAWPTVDVVPSCANAAFVEFASAQYRHHNPYWSFFAAVRRFLDALPADAYDIIFFDCPPAIGYQQMNAVFAADVLCVPSGPGYWEYDSTISFIGQLRDALEDLEVFAAGPATIPSDTDWRKVFGRVRFLLTRYEGSRDLHRKMREFYGQVFGDALALHPIEMTAAVEQSGRQLKSIYEIDPRDMHRETWRRARASFDAAWRDFRGDLMEVWPNL